MANQGKDKNKKDHKKNTVTDELTAVLNEITQEEPEEKKKGEPVWMLDEENFMVGERQYRMVADHRDAFNLEAIGERFSDVLSRYDYIVGDWGYDQLRLKGFFYADNRKAPQDQRIDSLEDYLYEYCNFGCSYFVIERVGGKREHKQNRRRRNKRSSGQKNQAHVEEKKAPVQQQKKKKPAIKNRKPSNQENKEKPRQDNKKKNHPADKRPQSTDKNKGKSGGGFVIRQRED